ncbi:MAG: DnaJ domain-containing protein [Rhodospirillales bacterium]|nr:DnaJ domain-containing protein [Rhodospirillales bacterium]
MPYFILGLAIAIGLVLIIWGMSGSNPRVIWRIFKWSAIIIIGAALVYLGATGRLVTVGWIIGGLLPLMLRWRAVRNMAKGFRGPSPGQTSDIETRYLRMQLDHDTGELRGTVLEGRFQGRLLQELTVAEQTELLQECRLHDEQSAQILETYLDRTHGASWRGGEGRGGEGRGGEDGSQSGGNGARAQSGGDMTRDEAYEILGVAKGAKPDEIRDAHRRLMLKNHPDHGGSTYLAAKINQAKELLLGS